MERGGHPRHRTPVIPFKMTTRDHRFKHLNPRPQLRHQSHRSNPLFPHHNLLLLHHMRHQGLLRQYKLRLLNHRDWDCLYKHKTWFQQIYNLKELPQQFNRPVNCPRFNLHNLLYYNQFQFLLLLL
eukprot:PhF_6_TR3675/c0_g1_i4/m.5193